MLTDDQQEELNENEDMKLAIDGMRAVFRANGRIQPKHRRALEALARFCRVSSYNHHKADTSEILTMTGRREVYNFIMFCLDYPVVERRRLIAKIKTLEDIRDGRGSNSDDDD